MNEKLSISPELDKLSPEEEAHFAQSILQSGLDELPSVVAIIEISDPGFCSNLEQQRLKNIIAQIKQTTDKKSIMQPGNQLGIDILTLPERHGLRKRVVELVKES